MPHFGNGEDRFRHHGDGDQFGPSRRDRHFGDGDHVRRFGARDDDFGRFGQLPAWHRRIWAGGYWGGLFWPRVAYAASVSWFLPTLPAYCPVYWYDNVPYYYYDDVYYVWSPEYGGYVAVDPPPVASTGTDVQQYSTAQYSTAQAPSYSDSTSAEVFAYPEHGQSAQQQQKDRRECSQWAAAQTASRATVTVADYRQAMIACFDARGYSAR